MNAYFTGSFVSRPKRSPLYFSSISKFDSSLELFLRRSTRARNLSGRPGNL
jgi:hypothetical protein